MAERYSHQLQFRFDKKATAMVVLLLPLLLWLGFWQLDRAEEKSQLQALYDHRQNNPPLAIEELDRGADLRYQPVKMRGKFVNEQPIFLDNRIYNGRFGYEIITPFKLVNSEFIVLVNRGWLAGDRSRRTLPSIATITSQLQLTGDVYVMQGKMMQLSRIKPTGWPKVVQSVDISNIADEIQAPVFPYTVRLKEGSPGSFQSNWQIINIQPEKHIGYAVQWFAMAIMLGIIAILANTNCWAVFKARNKSTKSEAK